MPSMMTGKITMRYRRGDVVLVPFPFTDLETVKTRPADVVSTETYEHETGNLLVAMITAASHTTLYDCMLHDWKQAKLLKPSWVRAKIATLQPSLIRFQPGRLSADDLANVDERLRRAFGFE
jgi:mRNA interferase MazF